MAIATEAQVRAELRVLSSASGDVPYALPQATVLDRESLAETLTRAALRRAYDTTAAAWETDPLVVWLVARKAAWLCLDYIAQGAKHPLRDPWLEEWKQYITDILDGTLSLTVTRRSTDPDAGTLPKSLTGVATENERTMQFDPTNDTMSQF